MSTISKPYTFSPNTSISSSQVNANFDTLYNDYNGGISAANLATDAVTTAKIADANVTTAKLADDAVTAAKIDFGGSGAGVWWEEIGRTTLSSAGDTITVSNIPARKYLMILVNTVPTGGTIDQIMRFNNDSGSNYARRRSVDGAADATSVSQSSGGLSAGTAANRVLSEVMLENTATQEKLCFYRSVRGDSGAANAAERLEGVIKWANTSNQVTRVDIINGGTGDYAIGSQVIVLGHD